MLNATSIWHNWGIDVSGRIEAIDGWKLDTLFTEIENEKKFAAAPLAVRMRPRSLGELAGQEDAVGPGSWLHAAIEADTLSSIILYGPAGTGKTSIAHIIAETTRATFVEVSAIGGTVADLRREIAAAEKRLLGTGARTILFVDEIHRFSRSQQDSLLHAVENRTVVLVGATTENPFFEVNSALISRSRVIELHSLSDADIECIVRRALSDEKRGLAGSCSLTDEALAAIVNLSGGDGRSALTTLELAAGLAKEKGAREKTEPPFVIDDDMVELATPHRALPYDKNKDMHYDVISAFIKSMRGSDPDAALYWLARMLDGGEDPKFIARRIFILASEDIGNADPQALLIAEAAFKAVEVIGMPECRINLSQAVTYMSLRAMRPKRVSTPPFRKCGMGRSATCRVIYATAIAPVRKTTVSINIRTIILAIGLNSAICPKALSVGASINRASRAGRPIGLMPHRAIGPRGLRSRRRASSGRGG